MEVGSDLEFVQKFHVTGSVKIELLTKWIWSVNIILVTPSDHGNCGVKFCPLLQNAFLYGSL